MILSIASNVATKKKRCLHPAFEDGCKAWTTFRRRLGTIGCDIGQSTLSKTERTANKCPDMSTDKHDTEQYVLIIACHFLYVVSFLFQLFCLKLWRLLLDVLFCHGWGLPTLHTLDIHKKRWTNFMFNFIRSCARVV